MPDEKLIEKIRAILRKAEEDGNDNEAERDVAMRAAQRLLLKHDLSMADIGDVSDAPSGRDFKHEPGLRVNGDEDDWQGTLLFCIAPAYFCKMYYSRSFKRGSYLGMLLGRENHIEACKTMHEFIAPQIEAEFTIAASKLTQQHRLARRYALAAAELRKIEIVDEAALDPEQEEALATVGSHRLQGILDTEGVDAAIEDIIDLTGITSKHYAKKVRPKILKHDLAPYDVDNLGVWRRSFFDAACRRVGSRLKELLREEAADLGATGTELVLNEKEALKQWESELDLGLQSRGTNSTSDGLGIVAGRAAGNRADLSGHSKVSSLGPRQLNR